MAAVPWLQAAGALLRCTRSVGFECVQAARGVTQLASGVSSGSCEPLNAAKLERGWDKVLASSKTLESSPGIQNQWFYARWWLLCALGIVFRTPASISRR